MYEITELIERIQTRMKGFKFRHTRYDGEQYKLDREIIAMLQAQIQELEQLKYAASLGGRQHQ